MRKMRWDCSPDKDGCFNEKMRVKLGYFDDCFYCGIGFGDVDGIVEINGFCMMLEWKSGGACVPRGQRIMFDRITADRKFTVLVIQGDAESMEIEKYRLWFGGRAGEWVAASLDEVKERIKQWVEWVKDK